jgi:hypothetical protein
MLAGTYLNTGGAHIVKAMQQRFDTWWDISRFPIAAAG